MKKIIVRDRESMFVLKTVSSIEEGYNTISQYEEYDKQQKTYKENSYEIVELRTLNYTLPICFWR